MLDATDQQDVPLIELEAFRAECVARTEATGTALQARKEHVAQLADDHGRLNSQLLLAQEKSQAAQLSAYTEVLENSDCDLREVARSLNTAIGPEGLILRSRDYLIFEVIPAARVEQLKAQIALRHAEWKLAEIDSEIHEVKLTAALGPALLLENDLEIVGAASQRFAALISLHAESHKNAELELRDFLVHQEKLRAQRVQAGILTTRLN